MCLYIDSNMKLIYICKVLLITYIIIYTGFIYYTFKPRLFNINHFNDILYPSISIDNYKYVSRKMDKYSDIIFITHYNMLYDIEKDNKINYFDVPLIGNYGYREDKLVIDLINNSDKKYIGISKFDYNNASHKTQLIVGVIDFIDKNKRMVSEDKLFKIYEK